MSIKIITCRTINDFMKRFNSFEDAELKTINIISPLHVEILLNVQDSAREHDWVGIKIVLETVTDARLVDEKNLSQVYMNDGISILCQDDNFILSVGKYKSFEHSKESQLFICSKSIKYEETAFI